MGKSESKGYSGLHPLGASAKAGAGTELAAVVSFCADSASGEVVWLQCSLARPVESCARPRTWCRRPRAAQQGQGRPPSSPGLWLCLGLGLRFIPQVSSGLQVIVGACELGPGFLVNVFKAPPIPETEISLKYVYQDLFVPEKSFPLSLK